MRHTETRLENGLLEEATPMPTTDSFAREIQRILADKLLVDVDSPDADLLQGGYLDSVALVQLLMEVEERFGIKLPIEELEIEDFRSVRSLARLVASHNQARVNGNSANRS